MRHISIATSQNRDFVYSPPHPCTFGQGKVENENKHSGERTWGTSRTFNALWL